MRKIASVFAVMLIVVSACCASCPSAYNDGCSGAPSGTPQLPHLLDKQQVTALNVIPGSGYTNGTYAWTSSGGGCSANATGNITVSGGALGGSQGLSYTITSEGSGCTSRPTIAVPAGAGTGTGGSITPTVYQAVPPWNVAGVNYYVGPPSGTTFADPTIQANLPSGATVSGAMVTVTGCNVTLNAFDFASHSANVTVNVTTTPCTTTIQNSKFLGNANALQNITISGTNKSNVLIQQDDLNGNAPVGSGGSGLNLTAEILDNGSSGDISLLYNYCHEFDAKCLQISGNASRTRTFTEKYNLFYGIDTCTSTCAHGEAEYTFNPSTATITDVFSYNTYDTPMMALGTTATSAQAVASDTVVLSGTTDDHNVILMPGPQTTCSSSNANRYTGSANVFDNSGSGTGGSMSNIAFTYNYLDISGGFFNWYHATSPGGTNLSYENNVDAGGGGLCNQDSKSPPTTPTPSPAAGSYTNAQSVSLSNPSGAPVICWNTNTSPASNGATGCTNGTVYSGPITVNTNQTIYFVAGGTGFTDSPQASAAYTISNPITPPAPWIFADMPAPVPAVPFIAEMRPPY